MSTTTQTDEATPADVWDGLMAQRQPPKSRRIANQAARTKLLHKVIGDDARVLMVRYREVDLQDLSRVLARAHSTTADEVQTALTGDPRFDLSGQTVTLVGRGDRVPAVHASPSAPLATLADNVEFALTETDTDRLLVTAPDADGVRSIRCDFVRGDRGEEIWIACAAANSEEWRAAAQAGAWSLGPGWKLPLTLASEAPEGHPPLLVFRERSASEAAQQVQAVVADLWGTPDDSARLEKITCTPAELERRVLGEQTTRRLVARAASRGPAVRTCERCGQPLTEPASVALGIGPECRKYYSAEVLRAVTTRSVVLPKPSAQKPTNWAKAIQDWFSGAQNCRNTL